MSRAYTPPNYVIDLDVESISKSLGLTTEQTIKEFKDARVTSRFTEYWAGKIYNYEKVDNTNNEGYDGIIKTRLLGDIHISIKSLTNSGVHFQQSKYIGSGRTCTKYDLLKSLDGVDFVIVIDITEFPVIKFIPINANILMDLVYKDLLDCNGYNKSKFYNVIFGKNIQNIKFKKYNLYENKEAEQNQDDVDSFITDVIPSESIIIENQGNNIDATQTTKYDNNSYDIHILETKESLVKRVLSDMGDNRMTLEDVINKIISIKPTKSTGNKLRMYRAYFKKYGFIKKINKVWYVSNKPFN